MPSQPMIFKVASEAHEFEMIHALNYRTFVEEIPQHRPNGERRLVDRYHEQNTYVVCLAKDALAGMVALRGERPFSLDEKLPDLDAHLPAGRRLCEIRLLAVEPSFRKTEVFAGLVSRLAQLALSRGYDLAVISGTVRQRKLYRHLGFEPFGPLVGRPGAEYQPMMLTLEAFRRSVGALFKAPREEMSRSFLPGPVRVSERVRRRFAEPAVSHRSARFEAVVQSVRTKLRQLTGAAHASLFLGSGTLANDVVGAQLCASRRCGLVLSNGEFGERLVDHASRWGLDFRTYRRPWGEPFDPEQLARRLEEGPRWVWLVHCETSTGMLNDLPLIAALCDSRGIALCVDAVSSLGTVATSLERVAFASAVSGKALAAYPGIAIVLHREVPPASHAALPRYLDLALYCQADTVPFTHSSNLLGALDTALSAIGNSRYRQLQEDTRLLRARLAAGGFRCLTPIERASPAIVTVPLAHSLSSVEVGERLGARGYSVAYASRYLVDRNWIQIALMGEYQQDDIDGVVRALTDATAAAGHARARGILAASHG